MIKSKFKRATSLFLATLMCVTTFAGIGSTTAYAASGEKADVYMVDFPRDGDANYDGVWGYSNLTLKNGWHTGRSNFTNLKAIGSYSGNVAYCIEPGISLKVGQTMNKYDENYFNNLAANGVISGDEIRLFVGRILQYGYRGTISTSWRSQNEAAANSIAQAYATQLLIWETVIGERDANFNHVAASGCSNVKDVINAKHPLRNKIFSYYNSMVQSVQNHATIPSFCNKSSGSAKTIELEWNGSKYTTTLTDSNNVGFLFTCNQFLYLLIVMWVFNAVPDKMVMVYAMVFGAHLLPYSWLYKSISYRIFAIIIPVLSLVIGCIFSALFIALTLILVECIFAAALFAELGRFTNK